MEIDFLRQFGVEAEPVNDNDQFNGNFCVYPIMLIVINCIGGHLPCVL